MFKGSSHIEASVNIVRPFLDEYINNVKDVLELSDSELKVAWVLELFNREDPYTWVNMYRIYEVINSDKNIVEAKWCNEKKRKRFTHTANNPKASGKEARHGIRKFDPPNVPMSLDDAKEMIDEIFNRWLDYKKENNKESTVK